MTPEEIRKRFWFGTHYYRPPTPLRTEWEDDFRRLKDLGLTTIQFRVFWCCCERAEGKYTWDDLDEIMDLSEKHGLTTVHQITLENGPAYIFNKYNGFRIDIRGQRIWPIANASMYPGGWIPCFDNPDVLSRGLEFVRQLVDRYKKHPAMDFWHAWNEPRSRPMGECACEYSIESYRRWLKEEFGTIEVLNTKYGKYWPEFDAIDAARDTSDISEMFLWRQWAASRVFFRVEEVVQTVRSLDPNRAVISHVGGNNMQNDPLFDMSDDEKMSCVADLYGSSYEVRYTPEPLTHSVPFLICDWMRHICRGDYTIYELYPSRGRFEEEIPAHQFQQWLWAPLASGARSAFLWQFKKERVGFETNEAGLIETDGSDNPTSLEAKKTFDLYKELQQEIASWRVPPARIAMIYDLQSDLVNRLELTIQRDHDHIGRYDLRYRLPVGHAYKTALQGTYHLFWLRNIPVDVVSIKRLAELIDQYEVLYLPALEIVDKPRAELLMSFVKKGGKLIVDAGFANRDSNAWLQCVRPAVPFGYQENIQQINPALREKLKIDDQLSLDIAYHKVSFQNTSAKALAHWDDGTPAVVTNTIGGGEILALGFSPGISYLITSDFGWPNFMEKIIRDWAGMQIPSHVEGVTCRELVNSENKRITFGFRRWGEDASVDEPSWSSWTVPNTRKLFELSHVKCFVEDE